MRGTSFWKALTCGRSKKAKGKASSSRRKEDLIKSPRLLQTLETCGRAHGAQIAVLQCLPEHLLKTLLYVELVNWEVPIKKLVTDSSEFIVLAICTPALVILRTSPKPVRGVPKASRSENITVIPWINIQCITVNTGLVPVDATLANQMVHLWSGEETAMTPSIRIKLSFRQCLVPGQTEAVRYKYNGFTSVDFTSFRGSNSSKLGSISFIMMNAWHEGILRVVKGVDQVMQETDQEGASQNSKIRHFKSMGDEILRDNIYTGVHVAHGIHYDSDNGMDYAPGHSFDRESHLLENISRAVFSDRDIKTAFLKSNRLVIHAANVLLGCARVADRILDAAATAKKRAELEQKNSLLGQPGGKRLVWATLSFFHSLMYGMTIEQAIMFLPHTENLLEAFSSDFSPSFRVTETAGVEGSFLDKSIRRVQLAVLVQLISDLAFVELEAENVDGVANFAPGVELERFRSVARLRYAGGHRQSFLVPMVIFDNLPILMEAIHVTRGLRRAIDNRDYELLRHCFAPSSAKVLYDIDPQLVARGREVLNELNSEHLEAAIEAHLDELTQGESASTHDGKIPAFCKHSALARAIRTAETTGLLDSAVADRARDLAKAEWERNVEGDDSTDENEDDDLKVIFTSTMGYHQVMHLSLPEVGSKENTYGIGWRKRGVDDRFTVIGNWVSAGQTFEHGEDEFHDATWGAGGAGANLRGKESFEDFGVSSTGDMVLRLRLRGVASKKYLQRTSEPWEDEVLVRWDPSAATLLGSSQNGEPASFVRTGRHSCDRRTLARIEELEEWADEERKNALKQLNQSLTAMGSHENLVHTVAVAERNALVREDTIEKFKHRLSAEQRLEIAAEHVRYWMAKARNADQIGDLSENDTIFFGLKRAIKRVNHAEGLKALADRPFAAGLSNSRRRAGSSTTKGSPTRLAAPQGSNQAKRTGELKEAQAKLKHVAKEKLKEAIVVRNYQGLKRSVALTEGLVDERAVILEAKERLAKLEKRSPSSASPVRARRRGGMLSARATAADVNALEKADALKMTRFPAMNPSAALFNSLRLFELILRSHPTAEILQACPPSSWHALIKDPRQCHVVLEDGGATVDSASREKLENILSKLHTEHEKQERRDEMNINWEGVVETARRVPLSPRNARPSRSPKGSKAPPKQRPLQEERREAEEVRMASASGQQHKQEKQQQEIQQPSQQQPQQQKPHAPSSGGRWRGRSQQSFGRSLKRRVTFNDEQQQQQQQQQARPIAAGDK